MVRKQTYKLVLALTSVLLSLICLEGVIRTTGIAPLLPKVYRTNIYIPHPILPYHQKPSITRTVTSGTGEFIQSMQHNSAGYRDVEHTLNKPVGTIRILGVGDSFTYGAGASFSDTYLAVLEHLLNSNPEHPQNVEIIKAGIGGFSPLSERLLIEHEGLAYQPDLILVGFNETDILETHIGIEEVRLYPGFLKNVQAKRLGYTRTWLILHSHLARLIHAKVSHESAQQRQIDFENSPEEVEAAWDQIENEFKTINDLATASGATLAVCYIPLSLDKYALSRDELIRHCTPYGIRVIDTSPYLLTANKESPVYWKADGHCTAQGYRAIAQALYETLIQKGGLLYP